MVHKVFEQVIYRSYILVALFCILNVIWNADNDEKRAKCFDCILNVIFFIVFTSIVYLTFVVFPVE